MPPDFFTLLDPAHPLTGLHDGVVLLYDKLLADSNLTVAQRDLLARLRAQSDIALKGLN